MKKMNLRKIMSCVIAVMMVVAVISPAAAQASPRGLACRFCGGNSAIVTVAPSHTNQHLDSYPCEYEHFPATKGTQWRCLVCLRYGDMVTTITGHYCEGKGGHYCWDGQCSCEN